MYLDKCSVCHAKDGSGNTAKGEKTESQGFALRRDSENERCRLDLTVANGKGKDMDGFQKELGADMVKQLVAYCRTLKQ